MSSFFNTTEQLEHVTPLPEGVDPAKGIDMLQGHVFFIQFDPHMKKYEAIDTPQDPQPALPDDRGLVGIASPSCYSVTDEVQTLPAGIWNSDVVSTYEFINLQKGTFVRIRSPLNVVMETVWEIREADGGGHELIEDVVIKCPRLLAGVVKNMCEGSWKSIHQKMMEHIQKS